MNQTQTIFVLFENNIVYTVITLGYIVYAQQQRHRI